MGSNGLDKIFSCKDKPVGFAWPKNISPVQTELAGGSQDVDHTLSPQLLAQDGGGNKTAGSPNSSTADTK